VKRILAALAAVPALAMLLTFVAPNAASAAPAATTWAWCSSNAQGTWQVGGGPLGTDYFVQNDAWNGSHGPQKICANSYHRVQVVSNQPTGNTEIMTYPDVSSLYDGSDEAVSNFSQIYNTFSESFPANTIAEAADDVWLNNWSIEIMVWVDTHHENISYLPVVGHATIFGQNFTVYRNGPAGHADDEWIFKLDHNETNGTTHVLSSIHWLMSHNFIPSTAKVTAVQFGWEIAGTNGPQTFNLWNYALHAGRK
jgi:hypothetical protein